MKSFGLSALKRSHFIKQLDHKKSLKSRKYLFKVVKIQMFFRSVLKKIENGVNLKDALQKN